MQNIKMVGAILFICIIVLIMFAACDKRKQSIDKNFDRKAIDLFTSNDEGFKQVKEYLLTIPKDIFISFDEKVSRGRGFDKDRGGY